MYIPLGNIMGIPLALLQVPHGGAANMPTQFGDFNQVQHKSRPASVVKVRDKNSSGVLLFDVVNPK